ncbi:MAG: hypothetical protein HYS86_01155, partial [Candidatus Chisholmbacteria bacterium]|nr:hypothetical protein [Candidatus Chisholmbacteria bacterium]
KTPTIKKYWKIIDHMKKMRPDILVVLMGDHVTAFPQESLEKSQVDYVLTGGELPVMVVVDSVVRLIPGVLGEAASLEEESFRNYHTTERGSYGMLEYPQYTRPEEYKRKKVPEILLSGNHAEIKKWRGEEALKRTKKRRPDLLEKK